MICASSSGVKSLRMLKVLRICSGLRGSKAEGARAELLRDSRVADDEVHALLRTVCTVLGRLIQPQRRNELPAV